MAETNPLAGLNQLKQATPQQSAPGNPYSTLGTTSDSNFLEGLTFDRNPEYIKAVNQGFWSSMGNSLVQAGAGIPLEVGEGIGYLGVGDIIDKVTNSELEFGNSFSNKMREWNEQLKQQGVPVYTTPENEGFKPWDYKWWATNMPSIASAVSLLIPAAGTVKGLGRLGKAMGGLNAAKKLGITTEAIEAGEVIAMAATSRHMEGMMEGMEVYQRLFDEAKTQGREDKDATDIAASGATDTYNKNWPLIVSDILQFGMAFKSFSKVGRIKSIEDQAKKTILSTTAGKMLSQSGLEAGEEGYQFVAGEEAKRKAAISGKLEEDDYSTYSERMMKYVADGDFWTSAFFGAIGGAAFEAVGSTMNNKATEKQKIVSDVQKSALEKSTAILKDDPTAFQKSTDVDIQRLIISGLEGGRVDKVEETLNQIKESSKENDPETIKKVDQALSDLKYLENIYSSIFKDPTKSKDQELIRFELANRAELRSNKRLAEQLDDMQLIALDHIAEERGLTSDYISLLKAQTELDLIAKEFSNQSPAEKIVQESKIKRLQEQVTLIKDTIKTNNNVTDSQIDEKLNINKSMLNSITLPKVIYDLRIEQNNKDFDKLNTVKGQDEIKKEIDKYKVNESGKAFQNISDRITPQSTFEELRQLKEEAKQLGKIEDFTQEYNNKLNSFRAASTKFSPTAPASSLSERYKDNQLLKEHEGNDILNIALKTGGLPENAELSEEGVAQMYEMNPVFAAKLNDYFAKADNVTSTITKESVKKQSTQNNPEASDVSSTEAIKPEEIKKLNKSAWNLQGIQFENGENEEPDITKPSISNVAQKINWDFLNTNGLPDKAKLYFEYDFEDEWNKKNKGIASTALFESIYYIDGNSSNKSPQNRKVVGVLSAYDEAKNYETAEAKRDLNLLRKDLYRQVVNSGQSSGLFTTATTTTVKKIIGGRFWNTNKFHKPTEILRTGDELILAIGRVKKLGDNHQVILDTNGHSSGSNIVYSNATPGAIYMLLKAPSGDLLPYKLFTHKVKEFVGMSDYIVSRILAIKDTKTEEDRKIAVNYASEIADIKDIKFTKGIYYITTGSTLNPTVTPMNEQDLGTFVNDLVAQVDVTKINKGDYNNNISTQGIISTDVNPQIYFHSTKVVIEQPKFDKVDVKSKNPNDVVPTPNTTQVQTTKVPNKIKGLNSTAIPIKQPKTKLPDESTVYNKINELEVKSWMKKNLPQVDISVSDNLIEVYKHGGLKAWGVFRNSGIELYKGAPKGTEHHEAFHAVFDMFLSPKEQETIFSESHLLYNLSDNLQIEEKLADDFIRYVQQQEAFEGKLGYNIKIFFKKLYQFFKSIFTNDIDIESLFFRINTGFYADKAVKDSNTIKYKINTDPYTRQRNIRTINYYFFEALNQYKNENSLGNSSDLDVIKKIDSNPDQAIYKLYTHVYEKFYATYEQLASLNDEKYRKDIDSLADLMTNFINVSPEGEILGRGDYYMLALRDLSKYGIKVISNGVLSNAYDSNIDEKQLELDEEIEVIEGWQVKALEQNGKDSLSYNVRKALRQTIAYRKNEEGEFISDTDSYAFDKFINFDEIYNYLERNLSGIYNIDTMMLVMEDLKNNRPEIYGILEKIKEDPTLRSQFFTNFAKAYIPYYQVQQDIKRVNEGGEITEEINFNVYNANRKNTFQLLVDDWYTNLITPSRNSITDNDNKILKDKTKQYLAEFDSIINTSKKKREVKLEDNQSLSSIIAKFGIEITPEALQNEFKEKPIIENNRFIYLKAFDNYNRFTDSIKSLLVAIDGGINPYKGDVAETSTVLKVAKVVSFSNSELHQDSIINVEGKQVYSYTLPTFIHKKFQEYKSQEGRDQYLSNWWFKRNKWLNDLSDETLKDKFEIVLLDGLKLDNGRGTKFFDMTDKELDTVDINMFWNRGAQYAYYRLPILSDSPQAPYIRFKKYNETEVIDGLYDLLLTEQERINIAKATDIKIKNWNTKSENAYRFQFIPEFNEAGIDVNNVEETKKFVAEWLEDKYKNEESRLKSEDILTSAGNFGKSVSSTAARTKGFLKEYFNNKVFANAMMIQLTSVDLAFYNNFDDFQKRNGQIFKFTKMINTSASWNNEHINPLYSTIYLEDELVDAKELVDFVYNDLKQKGYEEDYAKSISSVYEKINATDAQAYITIERYKEIMIGLGYWTDKHEEALKLIKRGYASSTALDPIYSTNLRKAEEMFLQPIKPFYFGHELVGDLIVPVQNKNSEVVLIPSLANSHPKLKKLLRHMETVQTETNTTVSVQFNSTVKAGEYGAVSADNIKDAVIHTLDNKYYGVQNETPIHHVDTENLLGSQLKKLITGDIPDNVKFFDGKYDKKQIIDKYQKLLTQNIIDSYNEVAGEFTDVKKVQKLLLEQVIERNLGEYFENALEIVKDQQGNDVFNLPLFHPIHAKRFENILNSIIRNRVTKQKINGAYLILMSSFGLSNKLKVVTNKKTGAVEYMEVMLPDWTKGKFPKNTKGEVDFDALKKEAPELLELFSYRIPTEHKYSMSKMKVVGFTPNFMGGITILPAEITKIAGEDFDKDVRYTMIPNFETKEGKIQKIKYNLDKIEEDSKEARDNAIIDIISEIWSHPSVSDQIVIPGGFDTLKKVAREYRELYPYDTNNSPILPAQQMVYFNRNSNGSKLIGIAANHNTNHAILQYSEVELAKLVSFDGHKEKMLNKQKAFDGKYISRNLSEFLAAFVDNAKEPVADDLNLNEFTFNTVAMIVRLGYSLNTALAFVNQPIIREYTTRYHRAGATRIAESTVAQELENIVLKQISLPNQPTDKIVILRTAELQNDIVPFHISAYPEDFAIKQMNVLNTFIAYKKLSDGLSEIVRATRADILGTGKTMAGNNHFLQLVERASSSKTVLNTNPLFYGDQYPLVQISTEYGIEKPMKELLSKYFPYSNEAYKTLYGNLAINKGDALSESEINYVTGLSLNYITSGFGFFDNKDKDAFINKFPTRFLENKNKEEFNRFELMRYIKYIPMNPDNLLHRIEFSSGTSVGNEQREIITRSWEAMLNSDNEEISKFARSLVKYSYFTSGLTFTPNGFGHLVPTNYIDKLVDTEGVTFRDYLYKVLDESKITTTFDQFVEQLYRHETNSRLLQRVENNDIINKIYKDGFNTSLLISPDKNTPDYIKMYNNGREYSYSLAGVTANEEKVYNILEPLGFKNIVFEFNRYDIKDSVIRANKLPKLDDSAFYPVVVGKNEIEEKLQVTAEKIKPNEELNNTLKQYLNKLDIKIEYINDFFIRSNNNAIAVANITDKLIKIAKYGEGVDTLPEETGHFAEAYNRGNEWHSRLMELVDKMPVYEEVRRDYTFAEIDDYKREAIGKLIGRAIIKKNQEGKTPGITDSISRIIQRVWDNFIKLFKKADYVKFNTEVKTIIDKVASDVLAGNINNLNTTANGEFYQLDPNISKEQQVLQDGIDSIYKKIKIYEERALTEYTDREKALLNKLQTDLSQKLYKKGLYDYTLNAARELERISKRVDKINRNPTSLEDKRNTIKTLNNINNYINGFKNTLNEINQSKIFSGTDRSDKLVEGFISKATAKTEKLSQQYFEIGKPILADILKSFSTNPNLDISKALDILETDITYTQRWLDALAETSDSILSIIDVMVKDAKQRGRLKTLTETKNLVKLQKELENAGIPSTNFMYERDFSGKISGSIVQEFNYAEYYKQRQLFFDKNPRPKRESFKSGKDGDRSWAIANKNWRKAVATWFAENNQPHPSKEEVIQAKKVEFDKLYPNNAKLSGQKLQEWLNNNTIITDVIDPESGEFFIKYIKELSSPSEKYKSQQYKDILANFVMKKYYDTINDLVKTKDNGVPSVYKLGNLAPQVRKDYYERLFIVDKEGKKSLKNVVAIGKETKTSLGELVIRHENDNDFGLTDENNQPINFLPVNYIRKLSDSNNLSLDMTSSMVAYLYSINDFSEMSKIIDVLEFTRDVIGERKVLTGKFDPITLFNKEGEKGKTISKEGKESLAYQRIIDYMDMTVYGRLKKDQGSWGQVDKGKLADAINTYTSLNSLALNIYSSIANVTVGNANIRMEAMAGEFVSNKDLFQADKIYTIELPKVLSEIGQRLDDSKLTLWVEHMDTLQNYNRDYRNIDAGRSTVFSRLMKTSSLYFLNHAGEHYIQTRMSLALAINTKVVDLLGNEMNLWDAFEVVDNKLVLKQGIKKVGKEGTGLFRENEDGQDVTEKDIIRFINRQNFINKRLHGIYNDVDKSAIQAGALGRLVIMFRKFIKPGWNRRFAKLTYNEEGEIYTEGYYATLGRFISNMYKELKEGKFSLIKNWGNLETYEKRNFLRLATEWAYTIAAITAAGILTQLADDDDDNYMLNLAAYESYRMYSEMRFFTSFTEMWRIVKSPSAAVYQVDKISRFLQIWNWGDEVKRGKYKGLNRFEVGLLELVPFAGTYTNFRTPEEQLRFYTNNGVSIF